MLNWVAQPRPGVEPPTFEARLYDVLFLSQSPASSEKWLEELNPKSLEVLKGAYASPALAAATVGDKYGHGMAWGSLVHECRVVSCSFERMSSIMVLFLLRLRVETIAEMWFNSSIILLFHCIRTSQHLLYESSIPISIHNITQQNHPLLSFPTGSSWSGWGTFAWTRTPRRDPSS